MTKQIEEAVEALERAFVMSDIPFRDRATKILESLTRTGNTTPATEVEEAVEKIGQEAYEWQQKHGDLGSFGETVTEILDSLLESQASRIRERVEKLKAKWNEEHPNKRTCYDSYNYGEYAGFEQVLEAITPTSKGGKG